MVLTIVLGHIACMFYLLFVVTGLRGRTVLSEWFTLYKYIRNKNK